jgi:cytochrome c-type biogenesis protein CcmH/NrfG
MRTRTQPPADTPVNQRRRRRWPILALALVVVLAGVFYLGGGWYFSGRLYQQALSGAGTVALSQKAPAEPNEVETLLTRRAPRSSQTTRSWP